MITSAITSALTPAVASGLGFALLALAVPLLASFARGRSRGPWHRVRALAARGEGINGIARRTRLAEDVVGLAMHRVGTTCRGSRRTGKELPRTAPSADSRQKTPRPTG
ncbi:MAG: hypothetical protein ACYC0B_02820 [Gemmatimonadaceae bacterium]